VLCGVSASLLAHTLESTYTYIYASTLHTPDQFGQVSCRSGTIITVIVVTAHRINGRHILIKFEEASHVLSKLSELGLAYITKSN
jgi:hypothetical protein